MGLKEKIQAHQNINFYHQSGRLVHCYSFAEAAHVDLCLTCRDLSYFLPSHPKHCLGVRRRLKSQQRCQRSLFLQWRGSVCKWDTMDPAPARTAGTSWLARNKNYFRAQCKILFNVRVEKMGARQLPC
jgi:hypothetical protein